MIRVLIDHDDWLIAAGIAATLELEGGFEVIQSRSAITCLERASEADVIVADYETALRLMRREAGLGAILILTPYASESQIRVAIAQGVSGYLLLGCTSDELLSSLHALSQGRKVFSVHIAAKLAESMRCRPLTDRELTVLSHVVKGRSDKDIGSQLALSVGTVKTHMKSILAKLGARRRTEAAAIARRRGLLPEPDEADWHTERAG